LKWDDTAKRNERAGDVAGFSQRSMGLDSANDLDNESSENDRGENDRDQKKVETTQRTRVNGME